VNKKHHVSPKHPRAESIETREKIIAHHDSRVLATAGLIAHGRGEAFDYLIGEKTGEPALRAVKAAAASLLLAEYPVISVNGNAAALVAQDLVSLAEVTGAKLEVNLYYRYPGRETAIRMVLEEAGAKEVLGIGEAASARLPEIGSERRRVDPRGILKADVVLVPLEDGDRTEALRKMGKTVIAIDLNPLSRTAQWSSITIVDNIIRALPHLVAETRRQKDMSRRELEEILHSFDNRQNLGSEIQLINKRLSDLAEKGVYIPEVVELYEHLEEEASKSN
jgi:4-phosphopantoate--beta-alanine ligase